MQCLIISFLDCYTCILFDWYNNNIHPLIFSYRRSRQKRLNFLLWTYKFANPYKFGNKIDFSVWRGLLRFFYLLLFSTIYYYSQLFTTTRLMPGSNRWTCPNCTLENEQAASSCAACDSRCPKPRTAHKEIHHAREQSKVGAKRSRTSCMVRPVNPATVSPSM